MTDELFTRAYLALFYDEESEYLAAIAALSAHLARSPENWRAWNNLGIAHHEIGELDDARTALDQAVERSDGDGLVLENRGLMRMDADDPAGAIADFTAAMAKAPGRATGILGARADAYAAIGDAEAAAADRAQARAIRQSTTQRAPADA